MTCSIEDRPDSRGTPTPRLFLTRAYADAVFRAGADPVLLPILPADRAPALLDSVHALVVSGGALDVPPSFYGETVHTACGPTSEERSAFERALVLAAVDRDLPLLGVCGGMQILNVALSGSLHQDLSLRENTQSHQQPHDKAQPHHPVHVSAPSLLHRIIGGKDTLAVNSTHHQVVKEVGRGLAVTAVAADGVVEAVELPGKRFVLGVQWHPESMPTAEQRAIYAALVAAAH
ncbi:MAG: gamma-glutamyl-gamma-aminobutyrate hydrolase family protein [Deltaproteobacteria bacterium]|nr:gamma-glutamyl-gamma-aminobutyrate hydrolase family protein [Deltaproteobacteria bacterium]